MDQNTTQQTEEISAALNRILSTYLDGETLMIKPRPLAVKRWNGTVEELFHPNLYQAAGFFQSVTGALHGLGRDDEARRVLRALLGYIVGRANVYYRNEGLAQRDRAYYRLGEAPLMCCCNLQESLSSSASKYGFRDLAIAMVRARCPRSPEGYYPKPSTWTIDETTAARHLLAVSKTVLEWGGPESEFMWTPWKW